MKKSSSNNLDKAMTQLQFMLGDDYSEEQLKQYQSLSEQQQLEEYIGLLDQRYQKILSILEYEDKQLEEMTSDNKNLKGRLAQIIQDAQVYQREKNQEIAHLQEKIKERGNTKAIKKLENHYRLIEIEKTEEAIEQIEQDIKNSIGQSITEQQKIHVFKKDVQQLSQQRHYCQEMLFKEIEMANKSTEELKESLNIYQNQSDQIQDLNEKNNTLKSQINNFQGKSLSYEKENRQMSQEFSEELKKGNINQKKFQNISKLKEKIIQEIVFTTEELQQTRQNNMKMESMLKDNYSLQNQLNFEQNNYQILSHRNDILKREYSSLTNFASQQYPQNHALSNNNGENKNIPNARQMKSIEQLLKLDQLDDSTDYKKQLEKLQQENLQLEIQINDKEQDTVQRNLIINNQFEAITKLKQDLDEFIQEQTNADYEQNQSYLKYNQLVHQMDSLSLNFQSLEKSVNQSGIKQSNTNKHFQEQQQEDQDQEENYNENVYKRLVHRFDEHNLEFNNSSEAQNSQEEQQQQEYEDQEIEDILNKTPQVLNITQTPEKKKKF